MLILFDIDATLITTAKAGIWSLQKAGRELHGSAFTAEGTEFAGRLDPLILVDLLRNNGVEPTPAAVAQLRTCYQTFLRRRLAEGPTPTALPGVLRLLADLRELAAAEAENAGLVLGLLTGNYPETGAIKLRACGIEPGDFPVQVWGDESPHEPPCRDHLPPVAIGKYRQRYGRDLGGEMVTVVGDTPYDVACARASGCRALGVATGSYSMDDLRRAGAHLVVQDLSQTDGVLSWLMQRRR